MRIGELSERTNTSRRLLRYYEEQGLAPEIIATLERQRDRMTERIPPWSVTATPRPSTSTPYATADRRPTWRLDPRTSITAGAWTHD